MFWVDCLKDSRYVTKGQNALKMTKVNYLSIKIIYGNQKIRLIFYL